MPILNQMTPAHIAHYQLTSKLGEGGMGAVYRATDTKLNREVAIKVLPPAFAEDTARMARFEREAQLLASLNHPNIAAIYGIETGSLVMELVEGSDLKGPVSVDTAIAYAKQIAAGLEAAHEKGIVHRDLKPANIRVTPDGIIKLLDFGLAKTTEPSTVASASASPTLSPTMSLAMTQAGMILGTAAYMSPEQAKGKPVDRRADIWAFGVIFFEMLSGKALYGGETVTDILAGVVLKEPDYADLPTDTPPHVRRLLQHCLRKDPRLRLRDIGDARLLLGEPDVSAPTISTVLLPTKRAWLPWAIAAVSMCCLATAVAWVVTGTPPPPTTLAQLSLNLPAHLTLEIASNGALAMARDGSRIAAVLHGEDGKSRIYTRALRDLQFAVLPGTEGGSSPAFSPDGRWIAYSDSATGTLKKVSLDGGTPAVICRAPAIRGIGWETDSSVIFSNGVREPLVRVSSSGGNPQPLTKFQPGEHTHRWPQVLPGGKVVLFTSHNSNDNYDDANIEAVIPTTGVRKILVRGAVQGRYLAPGRLLYLRRGTLYAAPFDLGNLTLTGAGVPVLEGVFSSNSGGAFFDAATNGTLVYAPGRATSGGFEVVLSDESGKDKSMQLPQGTYIGLAISPDGKRLAYMAARPGGGDLWLRDPSSDVSTRLTFLSGIATGGTWLSHGGAVMFLNDNGSGQRVPYQVQADGSREPQLVGGDWGVARNFAISPDDKFVIEERTGADGVNSLRLAPLEETNGQLRAGAFEEYAAGPGSHSLPRFSPDGRWVAYASDESGLNEIYVQHFRGSGGRRQVSAGGGLSPTWSRARNELLYQTPDRRILRAEYTASTDVISFGASRPWGKIRPADIGGGHGWDLSPDGTQIAAVVLAGGAEEKTVTELGVLINLPGELKRLP